MFGIKNYGDIRNIEKTQFMINWRSRSLGRFLRIILQATVEETIQIKEIIGLLFLKRNQVGDTRVCALLWQKLGDQGNWTYFLQYTEQTSKKGFWIPINDDYVPEGSRGEGFSSPTVQSLHPSIVNSETHQVPCCKGQSPMTPES